MVAKEAVQDMGQVKGDQVMEEQIVILEMGYKTDSEAQVVEQRDSEIQVEAKGLLILQEKVLETQGTEQNDLVIPVVHLKPVVIITNLVDMMPSKHKMEVDITISVIIHFYSCEWLCR
jgi:hypothetical protein